MIVLLIFALFALVLLFCVAILAGLAAVATTLLALAATVVALAMQLPHMKSAVNERLTQLDSIQCSEIPSYLSRAEANPALNRALTSAMDRNAGPIEILRVDERVRLQPMFKTSPRFRGLALEDLREVATREGRIPILFVNASRLPAVSAAAAGQEPYSIESIGPIVVYTNANQDTRRATPAIRVSSSSAVIFCNENLASQDWVIDAPLIVASNVDSAKTDTRLLNSRTPDGSFQIVAFAQVRAAATSAFTRMLDGDPLFEISGADPITDARIDQIRREVTGGMQVETIVPRRPSASGMAPATPQTPLLSASSPPSTTAEGQNDVLETEANPTRVAQDEHPADARPLDVVYQKLSCQFGFFYVKCDLKLDRKDLQFLVAGAFAKQGGTIGGQKALGPVNFQFGVTNPRVFFASGELGIQVDVLVQNTSRIADARENTLRQEMREGANPGERRPIGERVRELGQLTQAARNARDNAGRSLALTFPRETRIRNATITAAQIRYASGQSAIFLENVRPRDFELQIGQRELPNAAGFKPFILTSLTDLMGPFFRNNPVADLDKITINRPGLRWVNLSWIPIQSIGIDASENVFARFKMGWEIY